jgi:hypothetical protein
VVARGHESMMQAMTWPVVAAMVVVATTCEDGGQDAGHNAWVVAAMRGYDATIGNAS